jgi:hypothetical protein
MEGKIICLRPQELATPHYDTIFDQGAKRRIDRLNHPVTHPVKCPSISESPAGYFQVQRTLDSNHLLEHEGQGLPSKGIMELYV